MEKKPIIVWFRRDLRLRDHLALSAAAASGRPVIPVFLHEELCDVLGAAPKWRLGLAVAHFASVLKGQGTRLILRKGPAAQALQDIVAETGAGSVYWTRHYDPDGVRRDTALKAELKAAGVEARSFPGQLLFEPASVATGQGGPYRVYSPFWRAVKDRDVDPLLPAPSRLVAPARWPDSDRLEDWAMGAAMNRGAGVVEEYTAVGEDAAEDRLQRFLDGPIDGYKADRDFPAKPATSRLSENLTYGEISPHRIWAMGQRANLAGAPGAEHFLKELVWREFAWHLAFHTPWITQRCWREEWEGFPWRDDPNAPEVQAWQRGRTGERLVDAAMRELYVTGTMHNRARMIAASYLTKHLMVDWRIGQRWFAECLIDWDAASNAMGWQWVAGCGPDAAPYFRIFNPESQATKFDFDGTYVRRWLAEGQANPPETALQFFRAAPRQWQMSPKAGPPRRLVDLGEGRRRALAAYEAWRG